MENRKNRWLFALSTLAIIGGCYAAAVAIVGEPRSAYGYAAMLTGLSTVAYAVFVALSVIIRRVGVAGVARIGRPMLTLAAMMAVTAALGVAGAFAMVPKAGMIAAAAAYLNAASAAYAAQFVLYG